MSQTTLCCVFLKDKEAYYYYRDQVTFFNLGDPEVMLRCINPSESKLMDCAAGTRIRFRLAGVYFSKDFQFSQKPKLNVKFFLESDCETLCCKHNWTLYVPCCKVSQS